MRQRWPPWGKWSWEAEGIRDFQALDFPSLAELTAGPEQLGSASGHPDGGAASLLLLAMVAASNSCTWAIGFIPSSVSSLWSLSGYSITHLFLAIFKGWLSSASEDSYLLSWLWVPGKAVWVRFHLYTHTCAFMHHSLLAVFPLSSSALGILQSLTSPKNWLTAESFVHYPVWDPSLGVLRSEAVCTFSARVVPDMHTLCPITSKGNRKLSSNHGHKSK